MTPEHRTAPNKKHLRIAIACASLCAGNGGTERAAANLANDMTARGHQVTLLSLAYEDETGAPRQPAYPLSAGVRHLRRRFSERHADIRSLRETLVAAGTDVFLSMQSCGTHMFWAMVCMGSGIPFIYSERSSPTEHIERVWHKAGRHAVLSGADIIHELIPTYADSVPAWCKDRIRVIPNAAPCGWETLSSDDSGVPKKLLYLARFNAPKRPDLLVDAFTLVAEHTPGWELHMYGHGPLEQALRHQIAQSPHRDRIVFHGLCDDVASAYASAHIYCLPTTYEGFPNTALEAMNSGLPVVGLGCCEALRNVIREGETGTLSAQLTAESLAQALLPLMQDDDLRKRMGEAAKNECATRYNATRIHDQWEALFHELAQQKGNTVMDSFAREPLASRIRLSAAARREWLFRNFGEPMPYSSLWLWRRISTLFRRLACSVKTSVAAMFAKTRKE